MSSSNSYSSDIGCEEKRSGVKRSEKSSAMESVLSIDCNENKGIVCHKGDTSSR